MNFNPRAPCGARRSRLSRRCSHTHFNPRAPCGARLYAKAGREAERTISTHAPLAGRDSFSARCGRGYMYFNPRAPCGARPESTLTVIVAEKFQPTRPLRGATPEVCPPPEEVVISTHAPLAGRDCWLVAPCAYVSISTHAPLAGRDSKSVHITMYIFAITDKFQMLLHKMPPVRALCFFSMQKNHADLGANRPGDLCALALRTIRSSAPREDTSAYSQSVRFYSRTSCPGSKTAGCPFPGR